MLASVPDTDAPLRPSHCPGDRPPCYRLASSQWKPSALLTARPTLRLLSTCSFSYSTIHPAPSPTPPYILLLLFHGTLHPTLGADIRPSIVSFRILAPYRPQPGHGWPHWRGTGLSATVGRRTGQVSAAPTRRKASASLLADPACPYAAHLYLDVLPALAGPVRAHLARLPALTAAHLAFFAARAAAASTGLLDGSLAASLAVWVAVAALPVARCVAAGGRPVDCAAGAGVHQGGGVEQAEWRGPASGPDDGWALRQPVWLPPLMTLAAACLSRLLRAGWASAAALGTWMHSRRGGQRRQRVLLIRAALGVSAGLAHPALGAAVAAWTLGGEGGATGLVWEAVGALVWLSFLLGLPSLVACGRSVVQIWSDSKGTVASRAWVVLVVWQRATWPSGELIRGLDPAYLTLNHACALGLPLLCCMAIAGRSVSIVPSIFQPTAACCFHAFAALLIVSSGQTDLFMVGWVANLSVIGLIVQQRCFSPNIQFRPDAASDKVAKED